MPAEDPVITSLRAQEQACRELAASFQMKAQDARVKLVALDQGAADALAKAEQFRIAIESLGA